jgi:hypothetical protein
LGPRPRALDAWCSTSFASTTAASHTRAPVTPRPSYAPIERERAARREVHTHERCGLGVLRGGLCASASIARQTWRRPSWEMRMSRPHRSI